MKRYIKIPTKPLLALWRFRPLVVIAITVLGIDIAAVAFCRHAEVTDVKKGEFEAVTGTVKEKQYDETGSLKSMVVGNVLCYVSGVSFEGENNEIPCIGDKVLAEGCLYSFNEALNKGQFDQYGHYYARDILCYQSSQYVVVLERNGNNIREWLNASRRNLSQAVKQYCKVEYGTINTLLLGDKSGLSEYRKEIYTRAGVAHFLVISGLHITSIGSLLFMLFTKIGFKRKVSGSLVMLLLLAYGMCVGFSVSIVRALVMYAVRVAADILKKAYDMLNAVAVALIVVVAVMPRMVFDASFIYSFATVSAIAFYHSYVRRDLLKRLDLKGIVKKVFMAFELPLVLFVALMPVTLQISHVYSISGILVNVILAPLSVPIIALALAAVFACAFKLSVIAAGCDFLLALILGILDKVCEFAANIPLTSLSGSPGIGKLTVYYIFLVIFMLYICGENGILVNITTILSLLFFVSRMGFFEPSVSMLYVGQGECIVLRTSQHSCVMIDCGSTSESRVGKYVAVPFLQASGIERIDALFVTHTDADHVNGLEYILTQSLLTGVSVNNVFMTDIEAYAKNDAYMKIVEQCEECSINVVYITQSDYITTAGWSFDVLWPSYKVSLSDINAESLVMVASHGAFDILLTGDATKVSERRLPERLKNYSIDVLKVGHHGSYTSTGTELLNTITPEAAIISAGINNTYGHPHKETLDRLSEYRIRVYATPKVGEIDVIVKKNGYKLRGYLQ